MQIKCPKCFAEIEYSEDECTFCPECGSELAPSEQETESGSACSHGNFEKDEQNDEKLFQGTDWGNIFSKINSFGNMNNAAWDLSVSAENIVNNLDNMLEEEIATDCPYLKVEYNKNLFFLSGSESIMKLRITPLKKELQNILVFMETRRSGNNTSRPVPVHELLRVNYPMSLFVPYKPEEASGRIYFVFYIGCKTDKGISYYQFAVEHKVYDPNQSASSLKKQVVINTNYSVSGGGSIDTSIHASGAGEINYRNIIEDAVKHMGTEPSVHELIDRLNDLPAFYEVKNLQASSWSPEDIFVKGDLYHADKLLLKFKGKEIYLFNKTDVKLGRVGSDADLIVRDNDMTLGPRDYPNCTVSRRQAEILYCNDTVNFFDRSRYGTYINGRKPDEAGIPLEDNALIEFGDIHWKMNMQKCRMRLPHNICQTCGAHKIKSMTFVPENDDSKCYILVWQCCELGRVIEELADWTVFARNDCFFIRTPKQFFYYLRPGHKVVEDDKEISITYL